MYLWVGALDSPTDALLYSVDSMATLGASGLTLQRPWQVMGGLEVAEGQKLSFEAKADPRRGKTSAENLKML